MFSINHPNLLIMLASTRFSHKKNLFYLIFNKKNICWFFSKFCWNIFFPSQSKMSRKILQLFFGFSNLEQKANLILNSFLFPIFKLFLHKELEDLGKKLLLTQWQFPNFFSSISKTKKKVTYFFRTDINFSFQVRYPKNKGNLLKREIL